MRIKISELTLLKNNPRFITDDNFQRLKRDIESDPDFLEKRPVLVNKVWDTLTVYWGNQRVRAAKELGWDTIPCDIEENVPEDIMKKRVFVDNTEYGQTDYDVIANEWDVEEIKGWDLPELEFPDVQIIDPSKEAIEDEVPEEPENIIVEQWDIFTLWDHRLMCWDSTSIEDVEKLMDWEKADMVFTDPPYNLETKWGCKWSIGKSLIKQWKSIDFISNFDPIDTLNILPTLFNKNYLNSYIFCNKNLLPKYLNWAVEYNYSFNVLVWKKPNAIPIWDSHKPDIEYLLLFRKNAIWNNWLKNVNYSRCLEFWRELWLHPTMKPVKLLENELYISSNNWSVVIDLFLWSGSTLIACEKTNRKCYWMELDPKYVQVIIKRFAQYSPEKEIKCLNRKLDIDSIIK